MNEVMNQATLQMQKTLEATEVSLSKIRTGRAHPSLIESIKVNIYGSDMPLSQVASITAEDARTLAVSVWDKSQISAVEKAIMSSDLGLNPVVNGQLMRIPMPPLTQERRLDFIKLVKSEGESSKVSIRNARRDALDTLKNLKKDKALSEDEERQGQVEVQKITDQFIQKIEAMISEKEADLRSL